MPLPFFFSLDRTDCLTCSGLRVLEVEGVGGSRGENPDIALPKIVDQFRRLPQRGEAEIRRGGTTDCPVHGTDALLDLVLGVVLHRFHLAVGQAAPLCLGQVLVTPGCEPIACPAAATCLRISGWYVACRPMGKKMALVQFAASAANTAGVFFGQAQSSKVSTISPSRRKSWDLKCSKPNPGPPVVSISTTREIPIASGLPGQEVATRGAAAGAGAGAAAGAAGTAGTCGETCAAATVGVFSATIVDGELSVASGGEGGCAALA